MTVALGAVTVAQFNRYLRPLFVPLLNSRPTPAVPEPSEIREILQISQGGSSSYGWVWPSGRRSDAP
jgi:hypothetical protein